MDRYNAEPQYIDNHDNRQMLEQDSVQQEDVELYQVSSLRKKSCCLGMWSILVLIACVGFGLYFALYVDRSRDDGLETCDYSGKQWLWWSVCTPGLALMFFLYISIFKCTTICCCKCWECCGNNQHSKGATKCKICYEGFCGNPIFYGLGYIAWGIVNIMTVLSKCKDDPIYFRYGYAVVVGFVGITIIIFCIYHYYRTRRHWKKRQNRAIRKKMRQQQEMEMASPNGNNNNNMNNNKHDNGQNNLHNMNHSEHIPIDGAPNHRGGSAPPVNHMNGASLPYELEFEEGGEGGANNPNMNRNVPHAIVPSVSVNSSVPYGGGMVMNNGIAAYGGVRAPQSNRSSIHNGNNAIQSQRSMSVQPMRNNSSFNNNPNAYNNHNNNSNRNNNRNVEESVSISVTISDNQDNASDINHRMPPNGVNRQASRPAALSDPSQREKKHVRQVSFPKQFLGFARRASSGILQVMNDKEEECCICLEGFGKDDDIATLQCFHYFHKACIVDWLEHEKPECPVCNTSATVAGGKPAPSPP